MDKEDVDADVNTISRMQARDRRTQIENKTNDSEDVESGCIRNALWAVYSTIAETCESLPVVKKGACRKDPKHKKLKAWIALVFAALLIVVVCAVTFRVCEGSGSILPPALAEGELGESDTTGCLKFLANRISYWTGQDFLSTILSISLEKIPWNLQPKRSFTNSKILLKPVREGIEREIADYLLPPGNLFRSVASDTYTTSPNIFKKDDILVKVNRRESARRVINKGLAGFGDELRRVAKLINLSEVRRETHRHRESRNPWIRVNDLLHHQVATFRWFRKPQDFSEFLIRFRSVFQQRLPIECSQSGRMARGPSLLTVIDGLRYPRVLSNQSIPGGQRLRKLLADTAGSSSGLHGKWRSIVIANSVIGALGFLFGLTALTCCVWKKGAMMRCWWQVTCGFGDSNSHHEREVHEVAEFESTPGLRPMPPMSSPALYDLRMTLPDFRAASRQDSGDSRSRRSQTGSGPLLYGAEAFAFETLAAATGRFVEENKIGAGGFGSVYRGVLYDGRVVAIKRADRSSTRKIEENESAFVAELEVLSRLHHKYLVNLIGYCDDHDERLLVYEYMSNGTVHDHLHRHRSIALSSWQARIKVALQAARGIEYLHTYAGRQIIHRDIKSANILLDSRWNARVSDFGLSLISPFSPSTEEHSYLTTEAAGTLGYMDPEYYRLQHLTTKSDVYSFGVVLMELLTGKKAIHRRNTGPGTPGHNVTSSTNIVDFAVPPIRADELLSILDLRVRKPEDSENAAVEIMAEVAEQCVRPEGKDRPTMAEIVNRLETAYALSHATETSILRGYEASASAQIGFSRQLDSTKVPLDRHKGEQLELGIASSIPESQEYEYGTKFASED